MRYPAPVAAVVAKADALATFNPRLFGAVLLIGGVILACDGCRPSASARPAAR